ncbi:MBL fold metallo-hydrolase [Rossellomorea aquimaris]|uniref:Glyoxylase-like metal-dependent hydrolase (Beta-lactamase superfamily II) n=1 Tax=Rossellomorea aquimaris TaxID=189382 RepID=A0A366F1N4_9BACI|nr:MBL fold metallo-hydrolase [Rossellomorea aquimaris]RBP08066.1 glyoxylase-like metal-dependent hydrolase (beta-lactamase superfamily II) [Rossellomorea aquimaris]
MTNVKELTAKELTKKILNGDSMFILDVRPKDAFDDWKVEGKNVKIINKPFSELKENIGAVQSTLPRDEAIYVICAKGNSSTKTAEMLVEAGMDNIYSVNGGMQAWSEYHEPVKIGDVSGGSLYQFVRIGKGCLSYAIVSNGEVAFVDTSRILKPYKKFIQDHEVSVKAVFDSHLHADHISGGRSLSNEYNSPYYLPPKDAEDVQYEYKELNDDTVINVGDTTIKAVYSPGHTIGSTSFIVDGHYLLTGDILFIDSIGRPDLAGKAEDWVGDLRKTLYSRYKDLADELIVLPAHFMTIDEMNEDGSVSHPLNALYRENHGLNIEDEQEFRRTVTENLPPQPNSYEKIRETNMGKMHPEEEEQREMETGPNRCAVR